MQEQVSHMIEKHWAETWKESKLLVPVWSAEMCLQHAPNWIDNFEQR